MHRGGDERIGLVAEFVRDALYPLPGLFRDPRRIPQSQGNRHDGYTRFFGDHFLANGHGDGAR